MGSAIMGHIDTSARPETPHPAAQLSQWCGEFSAGWLSAHDSADHAEQGLLLCVAEGDARLPTSGPDLGQAAAWLAAWRRHGPAAATLASGRFRVAIVDSAAPGVWLACDRFGTWPLCYAAGTDRFSFADRADAVAGLQDGAPTLSAQALYDYLFFHVIPAPRTAFRGVSRVPAGHWVQWRNGRCECQPWWQPRFEEPARDDLAARKAEFLELVEAAVRREARHDACGAFLSGGTDSSTVSGMLCRVLGQPARTWSIGFDAAGYDEMAYARIAARHFGTEHHEHYLSPEELLDAIPRVAAWHDQPFGNSSAVPAWICAHLAQAAGVRHMLAGDGGDELFGGNTRYARQRIFDLYTHLPAILRHNLLEPALASPAGRLPLASKGASYVEQARVPLPDRLQMYNLLLRLGPEHVLEPGFLARVDPDAPFALQRSHWAQSDGATPINRLLAHDWKFTLADNDLPKVTASTRMAGLTVGFPLLSDELVDFSLRLPPSWKLKGLSLRWFFKEALRGFLPEAIITKKKHGFGLPFGPWACQHIALRGLARDSLHSLAGRGIVRPAFIDTLLTTHLPAHPGYYGEMVWILMMLELWLQAHADAAGVLQASPDDTQLARAA